MNDRFKFRVWDKKSNNYIKVKMFFIDKFGELFKYEQSKSTVYINAPSPYVMCLCGDNYIVEQCTGLKDKNGRLIYEGDIIVKSDVSAIGYSRTRVCKVHWHNDWLSWAITTQYGDTYELSEFEPQQYEIIGNIHENADLLENEE